MLILLRISACPACTLNRITKLRPGYLWVFVQLAMPSASQISLVDKGAYCGSQRLGLQPQSHRSTSETTSIDHWQIPEAPQRNRVIWRGFLQRLLLKHNSCSRQHTRETMPERQEEVGAGTEQSLAKSNKESRQCLTDDGHQTSLGSRTSRANSEEDIA